MPTIDDNRKSWDGQYDWANRGDEWSAAWGGPANQWHGTIFPRISTHLPTERIVEIACGFGRWTHYLKDQCRELVAIDLSEECVDACKKRFAGCRNIRFHVNDGRSLDMIEDGSVGFVFSYDSLVHADASVLQGYIAQFPRILAPDGAAFLHHSNLGEYEARNARIRSVPKLWGGLTKFGFLEKNLHWRDPGVDARKVAAFAEQSGLECSSQEIVHWGQKRLFNDCMTTIVKKGRGAPAGGRVWRNADFMQEAENLLNIAQRYNPRRKPVSG